MVVERLIDVEILGKIKTKREDTLKRIYSENKEILCILNIIAEILKINWNVDPKLKEISHKIEQQQR